MYSRALHSADFGDKKNKHIWKTMYCELLYRDFKNRVSANFYKHFILWIQCTTKFLELIENCVSAKSVLIEAVYNEALLQPNVH